MPSRKAAKSMERSNMSLKLQVGASGDRAAVAGASDGQKSPGGTSQESDNSDDDGKPPVKQAEDPEVSGEAGEQLEGTRYTQEDRKSYDATDCGAEKIRRLCTMENSMAQEIHLRDANKSSCK